MYRLAPAVLLLGLLLPIAPALAQSGSVPDPSAADGSAVGSATPAVTKATTTTASQSAPKPVPAATTPAPAATTPAPVQAAPIATTTQAAPAEVEDSGSSVALWIVLAVLALLPFGYFAAKLLKKKPQSEKDEQSGCFNIKKLLDDKLAELTDLRGQVENKAEGIARDALRESVRGTAAGNTLVALDAAEREYERLKKLYEKCVLDLETSQYKGTLVENSLADRGILEKLHIKQTFTLGDWTLHKVLVGEKQIPDLAKSLTDGPWYIHLWKPGKDEVRVVFKKREFAIKHSDKSTWREAVAYGKSIGIPEEQLDFPIE